MHERTGGQVVRQVWGRGRRRCVAALAAVASATALVVGGGVPATSAAPAVVSPAVVTPAVVTPAVVTPAVARPAGTATPAEQAPPRVSTARRDGRAPAAVTAASTLAPGRQVLHVGLNPQNTVFDPASHTLYVSGDSFVSVIDTATCSARSRSSCGRTPPRIRIVGGGMAIDPTTRTLYVTEPGDHAVAVVDIRTCNASVHSGCGHPAATVQVGSVPFAADVDRATDTIYVANWGNGAGTAISVIDGATCNARHPAGCAAAPASVTVGTAPNGLVVDQATDTVYVALLAPSGAQRLAVVNGAVCNARTVAGCGRVARIVAAGRGNADATTGMAVDERTGTLYLTNWPVGTVMMFDTATCGVRTTAGCVNRRVARLGPYASAIAVDDATRTVYVSSLTDDEVSVVSAATCNAHRTAGCRPGEQRLLRTGRSPWAVTVDHAAGTLYVPNGDSDTVSVLDGATCNATHAAGCTAYPATVSVGPASGPFGLALNPRTHSLYVVDSGATAPGTSVSVVDAATCNAVDQAGCGQRPPSVTVGQNPAGAAVDTATDTVYVANGSSDTVSVIDGATCNGSHRSGCGRPAATVKVGDGPFAVAVDQATHTVYVTDANSGTVSVIDAATCNAGDHAGCGRTPRSITVGTDPRGIAVDEATDTVYVTNTGGFSGTPGHTLSVIDGATCNASVASGCARKPQTVRTGPTPWGVAIDQATDSVYVADANDFSGPGSVTVIDGALCNATHHGRCGETEHTVLVGPAPLDPAVDQATGDVYVPDYNGAAVSVIHGAACDATHHGGCATSSRTLIVGGVPVAAVVDPRTHTVYVAVNADGTVAVLRARR